MKVGIIGTGWIAEKAAVTLNGLQECEAYAVGSRSIETAQAFAAKWNIAKACGSYKELLEDPDVDLVYVGTPHSHHYDVTRKCSRDHTATCGALKVLKTEDMEAIYRMAS
jgi:predicted dehydrogenase